MNTRVCIAPVVALLATALCAQDYPTRTIRFIAPTSPGGTSDILARMLAPKLSEALGQQVVVDNRAGAGTSIGSAIVAKSPPDGYTIGITPSALAINPNMFKRMPFDAVRDLAMVTRVAEGPIMLAIHPSIPARSVRELIMVARARPGTLNVASSGIGTIPHLAAELFRLMASIETPQVLYKGSGQAMISVISGELAIVYSSPISFLGHIKSGRLRGLGVTTLKRSPALPDVPAIAETLPGYEATQWFGVIAPAATPRPIIERLNRELVRALRSPDIQPRLVADGLDVIAGTPEELLTYLKANIEKWAKVVKAAGIQPE
jgi:tripartite-type tricarboxylate transporter receptor subunit TctC